LAWTLFIAYLIATSYLGFLGLRKTKGFSSFAIGDGQMSPLVVGITLAASTASAASFIVNPGFVYVHGLSAFMHLGISVFAGILCMFLATAYRFRKIGSENKAVTIPGWLGKRYKSKAFAIFFALINLFSFAFLVLLVGGISIVMQELLGLSHISALLITLIFVSLYVMMGGTYAHVFTNLLQGTLMIVVSLIIIVSGIVVMRETPDFIQQLQSYNPQITQWVNTESNLYNSIYSIYISGFLIGAALVCQPHILTKALYVKDSRDITRFIGIFGVVYLLFTCLLLAGFWAITTVPEPELIDNSTGLFRQDLVMTQYLETVFPDWLFTIISIVLLAAAMSTLDGLMVGLSTIAANDFFVNITERLSSSKRTLQERLKLAYKASHVILIILAILCFLASIDPPRLLGIYGQFGVYALVLCSFTPLLMGIYFESPKLSIAWSSSILALTVYTVLYFYGSSLFPDRNIAFANPAVPAGIAILSSSISAFLISYFITKKVNDA